MKLSHSKMGMILTCPMTYKVAYKMGISLKETKPSLRIGSAVHYGIEHETEDLSEFYKELGSFSQANQYTKEQELAEAMVMGYLNQKNNIFADLLIDDETGEPLELYEEMKELDLVVPLPSLVEGKEDHEFRGIIDLLLLTNKGFIIIDYKTSSRQPDWDNYLEQIYRYVFIVETLFPDVPVYKLAIINLIKSGIRQKRMENEQQFRNRLRLEYELNEEKYINYHVYPKNTLDKQLMDDYILNLRRGADFAQYIEDTSLSYLNYGNLITIYGKSEYYDIFKRTPDAYVMYDIRDTILDTNDITGILELKEKRDARQIDIDAVFEKNVLHKYDQFKTIVISYYAVNEETEKNVILDYIRKNFKVDEELLERYWQTLEYEIQHNIETDEKDKKELEIDED